jgi:hypothetical protein
MSDDAEQIRSELRDLRLNADQKVSSHSFLRDYYHGWGQRLNIYVLLGTAALLCFTLVSDDFVERTIGMPADSLKWAEGGVAFLAFCLSLIDLTWNPAIKAKAHDQAVTHYLRMNYEIRNLRGSDLLTRDKVRWLEEEFLDVTELPRIPEDQSLELKQRYLKRMAISEALERNPHQSMRWLSIKLWWMGPPAPPVNVRPVLAPPPPLLPKDQTQQ